MIHRTLMGAALLLLLPAHSAAQAAAALATEAVRPQPRQSWLSDRVPLRVGDLLTILIDESTLSSERSSAVARAVRSQEAGLASSPADAEVAIKYGARSDNTGKLDRSGQLAGVLSVRVVEIEANGVARIEGRKTVVLDGRSQDLLLTGLVRTEDVTPGNAILSSRVAEAVITYRGKKIGPSTGIVGKLLGLLWP